MAEEVIQCACGEPLHYDDLVLQTVIEDYVKELGPEMIVTVRQRQYLAQRHYIALHGFKPEEAESLADQGVIKRLCGYCGEIILPNEELAPIQNDHIHRECGFRMVAGSVGHQSRQCSCHGREDTTEAGMSKREAARAALKYHLSRN